MTTKRESTYLTNFYIAANECSMATHIQAHAGKSGGNNQATGAAAVNKDPLINL